MRFFEFIEASHSRFGPLLPDLHTGFTSTGGKFPSFQLRLHRLSFFSFFAFPSPPYRYCYNYDATVTYALYSSESHILVRSYTIKFPQVYGNLAYFIRVFTF